ncbi:XRE family transcriptional regulator [Bacillus cereus]|uniref:helix-turn-helix domain-containing protein n=1 Tax=Bacilli TaxID=91061 RepID=UPI0005E08EEF|nr:MULTISPECIES: helix-turn-helix transcriptional regulator [Bacilli]MED1835383.1 helix-turn-helix transcriptional regulator [Bacillus thuringiensis]PDZ59391.1 XRE family transcriptional regulator [Bacillus cereus]PEE91355.1 XRE family transcriptional regulator [Bacillus cereus]PGN76106.1 XRE family transcriptional regulator [Bacillus cereus]PGO75756.1 XRE family transcriptional regulator [Bacillus cereus]
MIVYQKTNNREVVYEYKDFMDKHGLQVNHFAKKVGLSRQAVSMWSNSKLNLAEDTLKRISDYMDKYDRIIAENNL